MREREEERERQNQKLGNKFGVKRMKKRWWKIEKEKKAKEWGKWLKDSWFEKWQSKRNGNWSKKKKSELMDKIISEGWKYSVWRLESIHEKEIMGKGIVRNIFYFHALHSHLMLLSLSLFIFFLSLWKEESHYNCIVMNLDQNCFCHECPGKTENRNGIIYVWYKTVSLTNIHLNQFA